MKKDIKNTNMVEIANNRMMSIYESIMSEGIMGALGGAAIGAALGAGGAALAGKENIQSIGAVKTGMEKVADLDLANKGVETATQGVNDATTALNDVKDGKINMDDLGDTLKKADDALAVAQRNHDTAYRELPPEDVTDDFADKELADAQAQRDKAFNDLNKYKNADANLEKATKELETAKAVQADKAKNVGAFDKALNQAGNNHIAAGAAVGGTLGGVIGAFAHDDDRKDESDDEVLEDDERLF